MEMISKLVTDYVDSFYKPLTPELGKLRAGAELARVPIIRRESEALLLSVLRLAKPLKILEIGTAVGYSAACFAECLQGASITTIESDPETADAAIENMAHLGYSHRVTVLKGDAREVLKELGPTEKFDFVFIDAAKGHYRQFWDGSMAFCRKGTIIMSDNILMRGCTASDQFDESGRFKTAIRRMRDYLDYITNLSYASTEILSSGDGMAISFLTRDPEL